MVGAFISFFYVIMIIGISLVVSFGLIFCLFSLCYGFFREAHKDLSSYRFPNKAEILENLSALFTVTILVTTGFLCYFYFEFSILFSILLAFIATFIFVAIIKFSDVKKEYRKLKRP